MNRFLIVLALCACGNPLLIQTFDPAAPDAGQPVADAGVPDAGPPFVLPDNCSSDGWCPEDAGTGNRLRSVFALDTTHVYVVGDTSTFLINDGIRWTAQTPPTDDYFAVWASAPDDVWLAGGALVHFDGTTFQTKGASASALFGFGRNDVWAVGNDVQHYAGASWASSNVSSQPLTDVTGLGGKLWAVGASGTLMQFNAGTWSPMQAPPTLIGGLAAVIAFTPADIFAAGGNDWLTYDGTQWTHSHFPIDVDMELLGLWGASPSRLWAVGPSGKAWRIEQGNATRSDTGTTALLRDIHGVDERHVWAVGFDGTVLRRYGP